MASFLKSRRVKYGSNALTAVLMMLGILVVVNFLSNRYHRRFDMTQRGVYTLSDQTVTLLRSLQKDVNAVAFFREQDRAEFEHLLEEYAYHSGRFSYRFVNLDKEPLEARRYSVKAYGTTIVEAGKRKERIFSAEEKDLTNAIARAIRDEVKVIYFLTGHREASLEGRERDGYSSVKQLLVAANYDVRDGLLLARTRRVPDDCDLLVVAGPGTRLYPAEVDSIASYLEQGGAGLFMLDPGVETGLEPVLKRWAIGVNDDYVVEDSAKGRLHGLDHSMPVVARYADHPITAKHTGLMTVFMIARSVSRAGTVPGVEAVELLTTSPASWGESDLSSMRSRQLPKFDPEWERQGPLSLAMAASGPPADPRVRSVKGARPKAMIVVFGDSDFANNQLINEPGNADLFLNAVNWLLKEGARIAIRPRERAYRPVRLTESDGQWIKWFSLVLLPAIPAIGGVLVWWWRR